MPTLVLPLLALSLALVCSPQEDTDPPAPETSPSPEEPELRPGVLPEGISAAAREAWLALCATTRSRGTTSDPVRSFELAIDARVQTPRGHVVQSNDVRAVYRYLAPGWVWTRLESGRVRLRGPDGDWLIDGEERIKLVGREHAEDKKDLDQTVAIARNFIALTDPGALRIAALRVLPSPPAALRALATDGLTWLEIESPDFRVHRRDRERPRSPFEAGEKRRRLVRAILGVSQADGLPDFALIVEQDESTPGGVSAMLLRFDAQPYFVVDGFRIPRQIHVHGVDTGAATWRVDAEPSSDLWVKTGDLRAELDADDFRP